MGLSVGTLKSVCPFWLPSLGEVNAYIDCSVKRKLFSVVDRIKLFRW